MYFLVFILGFLISGVWFGSLLLIRNIISKKGIAFLVKYSPLLSACIPTIIVCNVFEKHPFNFMNLLNWQLWVIALITICLTSFIILIGKKPKINREDSLREMCIEAAMMEVPQRVMMQTFCCGLLYWFNCNHLFGIVINGFIWCADIVVQAVIFKESNKKALLVELLASFAFSLGIGYVFYKSNCIIISMLSHSCERYLTQKLSNSIEI